MITSCGVPFEGWRLPSDQRHHIDCMLSPSSVLGWMLICSAPDVHDCCHLSCRTFSVLSHVAVSFWPRAVRSIVASYSALSSVACHKSCSSRLSGSVSDSDPSPSERCETYHRCPACRARSSCARRSSRTSSLRLASIVCWIAFFTADNPVLPSARTRIPAISCSEKADVWTSQ